MRILIIDDNPFDAQLAQYSLESIGEFEFDHVKDFSGLKKIFSPCKYATIISDYALLDCLGTDILQYVRESEPEIPFIIISGSIGDEDAIKTLRLGATDYVLKTNIDKLPLALLRALKEAETKKAGKAAIQQLEQNEKRFRALIENSTDIKTLRSPDGKLLYSSPSLKQILGYSHEEYMNISNVELIHPEDIDDLIKKMQELLQKPGESFYSQYRLRHKNGSWCWCESAVTNMLHDPNIGALVSNFRDISEKKDAEDQLKKMLHRFAQAQETAHVGSWELSFATGNAVWSDEACRIYGISITENIQPYNVWLSYIHPDDINMVNKEIEKSQVNLSNSSFEHRIVLKDGTVRDIYSVSKFEFDEDGKPIGLYGICHDITEIKKAERRKAFHDNNLNALINNTNDLMWSVDRKFKLITCNTSFNEMVKSIIGKFIEKGDNILSTEFPEEQIIRYKEYYEKAFEGENFTVIESTTTPVEFWSEISFYPMRKGDDIIGTACYARDITERKKAEKIILQKNKKLRDLSHHLQTIREEERMNVAREIHDELGQQLTALKMDIDWILHKQKNPEEAIITKLQDMLKMNDFIINTVRRISSDLRPPIIDDLGLIPAIEWKCADFEEKTGISCQFISEVKEQKFSKHFSINVYRILQETLTNISRHAEAKNITVLLKKNETDLFLGITDDGKGITKENIHNSGRLGILGMRERSELLDGKLLISGVLSKGTQVKLILPLKDEYIIS